MKPSKFHTKRMFASVVLSYLLAVAMATPVLATEPWNLILLADPHREIGDLTGNNPAGTPAAPGYSGTNRTSPQQEATLNQLIVNLRDRHQPEVALLAGDLGAGHWYEAGQIPLYAPGGTALQSVEMAASIFWPQFKHRYTANGIDNLLVAVGDHEIGDNDWPVGSVVSPLVPTFRAAFATHLLKDQSGDHLFGDLVCGAPARPYGTIYADTSYAFRHKNVVVVTLDVFRQDDPAVQIDPIHGTVAADVEGNHLAWVGQVLAAADADPTVDHVVIQGHTAVLGPVRTNNSSGMLFRGRDGSPLWQLLRTCSKARFYLGGEVHALTVSKDPESEIFQVVGNAGATYVVCRVSPDNLQFESYVENANVYSTNNAQVFGPANLDGTLSLDYSGASVAAVGTGSMEPINQRGLLLHYPMDEVGPPFANLGNFGPSHDGVASGTTPVASIPGKLGNAVSFDGTNWVAPFQKSSPITGGEPTTIATWIRTSAGGNVNFSGQGRNRQNSIFNFGLRGGKLSLSTDNNRFVLAADSPFVNDGQWHHVAVVVPSRDASKLGDLIFHIDGVAYGASTTTPNEQLNVANATSPPIIGASFFGVNPRFVGAVDDLSIWGSGLPTARVAALFHAANELQYNTAQVARLFDLFDGPGGSETIGESTWSKVSAGLMGAPGTVTQQPNGSMAIVLDETGGGVISQLLVSVEKTVFQTGFEYDTPPVIDTDAASLNGATGQIGTWSGTVPSGSVSIANGRLLQDIASGPTASAHTANLTDPVALDGATVSFDFALRRFATQTNNQKDLQVIGYDSSGNQVFNITASGGPDKRWEARTDGNTTLFTGGNVTDLPGASDADLDIYSGGTPGMGAMTLTLGETGYTMSWSRGSITWTTDTLAYNGPAAILATITFHQNAVVTPAGYFLDNVTVAGLVGTSPMTGYAAWVLQQDGLNATNSLLTDNPDGDTLNNLLEYALGGSPTGPDDPGIQPTAETVQDAESQWFEYVYRRRIDAPDLVYSLAVSSSLDGGSWTNIGTSAETGAETDAGDPEFEFVTNRIPMSGSDRQFVRLGVQSAPSVP